MLLWHSAKTHELQHNEHGVIWQHRGAPSAGGIHPVELILLGPAGCHWECARYDPIAHALRPLALPVGMSAETLRRETSVMVEPQQGTVLLFVADHARNSARYERGESLVWRDAGALVATVSFVAEALNLNSCALGFTGDDMVRRMFTSERLGGAGGVIVGSRANQAGQ